MRQMGTDHPFGDPLCPPHPLGIYMTPPEKLSFGDISHQFAAPLLLPFDIGHCPTVRYTLLFHIRAKSHKPRTGGKGRMTIDDMQPNTRDRVKKIISNKADRFTESVTREMPRQANLYGAINLSQGFPDFAAPAEIKQAACDAILADINQYAITWGAKNFRNAIAEKAAWYLGLEVDPERHITVTCGSTEAMMAAMMAIINPGDEGVVFEPFYENYGPDAILSGATPRYVTLHEPDWTFDPDELAAAFNDKTKAIILNTPNNPTGKVFTRDGLETIAP